LIIEEEKKYVWCIVIERKNEGKERRKDKVKKQNMDGNKKNMKQEKKAEGRSK
jgi:hypothetical protein